MLNSLITGRELSPGVTQQFLNKTSCFAKMVRLSKAFLRFLLAPKISVWKVYTVKVFSKDQ